MKHGSLFSGIGGFDLAAEWMGWENVFHCEWNTFGQKVLKYYWPKSISYDDITKTDFTIHRGNIDILTGGFPCQPYSSAGRRRGKEDERHLWPQMLRAIREIAPSWVVGENVYGLVNWSGGLVFHEVQADLEAEGYEVFPFLLPAVSVNAPHRRDRIWFVAHTTRTSERTDKLSSIRPENGEIGGERTQTIHDAIRPDGTQGVATNSNNNGLNECNSNNEVNSSKGGINALSHINESNGNGYAADTMSIRLQQCENREEMGGGQGEMGGERSQPTNATQTNGKIRDASNTNGIKLWGQSNGFGESRFISQDGKRSNWETFPTVSPVCFGDDGLSDRLDSITFPKWRNESIKAGGNAIVPQVVYQIFKSIEQYERTYGRTDNEGGND